MDSELTMLLGSAPRALNVHIYEYLKRRSYHHSAQVFKEEADVSDGAVQELSGSGFLFEWWNCFWDTLNARAGRPCSAVAAKYVELQRPRQARDNCHPRDIQLHDCRMLPINVAEAPAGISDQPHARPVPGLCIGQVCGSAGRVGSNSTVPCFERGIPDTRSFCAGGEGLQGVAVGRQEALPAGDSRLPTTAAGAVNDGNGFTSAALPIGTMPQQFFPPQQQRQQRTLGGHSAIYMNGNGAPDPTTRGGGDGCSSAGAGLVPSAPSDIPLPPAPAPPPAGRQVQQQQTAVPPYSPYSANGRHSTNGMGPATSPESIDLELGRWGGHGGDVGGGGCRGGEALATASSLVRPSPREPLPKQKQQQQQPEEQQPARVPRQKSPGTSLQSLLKYSQQQLRARLASQRSNDGSQRAALNTTARLQAAQPPKTSSTAPQHHQPQPQLQPLDGRRSTLAAQQPSPRLAQQQPQQSQSQQHPQSIPQQPDLQQQEAQQPGPLQQQEAQQSGPLQQQEAQQSGSLQQQSSASLSEGERRQRQYHQQQQHQQQLAQQQADDAVLQHLTRQAKIRQLRQLQREVYELHLEDKRRQQMQQHQHPSQQHQQPQSQQCGEQQQQQYCMAGQLVRMSGGECESDAGAVRQQQQREWPSGDAVHPSHAPTPPPPPPQLPPPSPTAWEVQEPPLLGNSTWLSAAGGRKRKAPLEETSPRSLPPPLRQQQQQPEQPLLDAFRQCSGDSQSAVVYGLAPNQPQSPSPPPLLPLPPPGKHLEQEQEQEQEHRQAHSSRSEPDVHHFHHYRLHHEQHHHHHDHCQQPPQQQPQQQPYQHGSASLSSAPSYHQARTPLVWSPSVAAAKEAIAVNSIAVGGGAHRGAGGGAAGLLVAAGTSVYGNMVAAGTSVYGNVVAAGTSVYGNMGATAARASADGRPPAVDGHCPRPTSTSGGFSAGGGGATHGCGGVGGLAQGSSPWLRSGTWAVGPMDACDGGTAVAAAGAGPGPGAVLEVPQHQQRSRQQQHAPLLNPTAFAPSSPQRQPSAPGCTVSPSQGGFPGCPSQTFDHPQQQQQQEYFLEKPQKEPSAAPESGPHDHRTTVHQPANHLANHLANHHGVCAGTQGGQQQAHHAAGAFSPNPYGTAYDSGHDEGPVQAPGATGPAGVSPYVLPYVLPAWGRSLASSSLGVGGGGRIGGGAAAAVAAISGIPGGGGGRGDEEVADPFVLSAYQYQYQCLGNGLCDYGDGDHGGGGGDVGGGLGDGASSGSLGLEEAEELLGGCP